MSNVIAEFEVNPAEPIAIEFTLYSYNNEHNLLRNRDMADQHPMGAITGLITALNSKQNTIEDLQEIREGAELGATAVQSVTTGSTNGTISVDGNDVPVRGLGSAAYTASTAYATSAQGEKADTALQPSALSGYATESYVNTADGALQSQIDALSASSDVTDIVGTYAELQAYDTTKLKDNDIIKVLQDETHDNETTYYRWNLHTETFTLIGEEGPYYTIASANATFVPQTRKVNNKALSEDITLTASDVGADASGSASTAETNAKNYADSLASNYATSAQGALADTAVQPADIANMQTTTNLVTSVSSASTDTQYPSAKWAYDTIGDIETLINAL